MAWRNNPDFRAPFFHSHRSFLYVRLHQAKSKVFAIQIFFWSARQHSLKNNSRSCGTPSRRRTITTIAFTHLLLQFGKHSLQVIISPEDSSQFSANVDCSPRTAGPQLAPWYPATLDGRAFRKPIDPQILNHP